MPEIIDHIKTLFATVNKEQAIEVEKIPQSGSDRIYFRIKSPGHSYIATYGHNIKENETFIYFSRHFKQAGCPVPAIFSVNEDHTIYIQQDFGDESLLNKLEAHGYSDYVYRLFQQSLQQLAQLQIHGGKGIDYNYCLTAKEFGKQAILSDLLLNIISWIP